MKQTAWGRQAGGQSHSCSNLWSSRGGYCWLCAENIASTWEYHQLGLWAGQLWGEITTTPISISVPIMCHRESYGQWIGPRANTERPLSALYHLRTIVTWPGFGHQEPGAGCRGQETTWSLVTTCWRGLGPPPPVIARVQPWPVIGAMVNYSRSPLLTPVILGREAILWKVTESKWPLC